MGGGELKVGVFGAPSLKWVVVCVREELSGLSLGRQTAGQTGSGEQWAVWALT